MNTTSLIIKTSIGTLRIQNSLDYNHSVAAFVGFFLLIAVCFSSQAATLNCNGSASDTQSKINSVSTGDTVGFPSGGSYSWTSGVTISGKGLTINLNGSTITRPSGSIVLLTVVTDPNLMTRITNGTLTQSTSGKMIQIGGGFSNPHFRLDHLTLTSAASSDILIVVNNSYGLIDHCNISANSASEMVHNEAYGAGVTTGWSDVVIQSEAVYIEDCTFSKYNQSDAYFWGTSAIQSYYGARTVIRHNLLNYCQIDQHGTAGNIGARWWEIYNNNFNLPSGGGNQSNYMAIRAGSGVIFSNTISGGHNNGAGSIELYEEDSGYPALYQIGRGQNQALDPAYCWSNDVTPAAGSSNVQVNRDFYLMIKPGYTPYIYPNPLQGITPTPTPTPSNPAPPSNLRIE